MAEKRKETSLFKFSRTGGCAAKLDPISLGRIMETLATGRSDPNLLTDFSGNEDAAVYVLSEDTAIVFTVDVIAPPVDNPAVYGEIAAANAISDVYAMGGTPRVCLSILATPQELDTSVVIKIASGADKKIQEADAMLVGGHTVTNDRLLFGLAVVGTLNPHRLWRNSGAQVGDAIILTKPIGMGVIFSALRHGEEVVDAVSEAIRWSSLLNRSAAIVMSNYRIHSATDVTGFGMLGHIKEIACASGVACAINSKAVPCISSALAFYEKGLSTSITNQNMALIEDDLEIPAGFDKSVLSVFHDPQTNGGLLFTVPREDASEIVKRLRTVGLEWAAEIGVVRPLRDNHIILT